jgi:hypothetical protein
MSEEINPPIVPVGDMRKVFDRFRCCLLHFQRSHKDIFKHDRSFSNCVKLNQSGSINAAVVLLGTNLFFRVQKFFSMLFLMSRVKSGAILVPGALILRGSASSDT